MNFFLALPECVPLLVQQRRGSDANGWERSCWGALDDALELGQTLVWAVSAPRSEANMQNY
eukprot:1160313-Pelagomonas_calceolata.AAC.4